MNPKVKETLKNFNKVKDREEANKNDKFHVNSKYPTLKNRQIFNFSIQI